MNPLVKLLFTLRNQQPKQNKKYINIKIIVIYAAFLLFEIF